MKLEQSKHWFNLHRTTILWGGGALMIGILAGHVLGNWSLHQQQQQLSLQLQLLQNSLDTSETQLADQRKQVDYLTAELAVERHTSELQMQDLKSEQQKLFETRKELAFYQKIISPDLQANSLIIDSFTLSAGNAVGKYKFNLVLIDQDKQKNYAKGQITLTLVGKKAGKKSSVDLLELSGFSKADRRFSFKHFQIFEGEFVLPSAFIAEQVDVTVSVPASRGQKAAKVSQSLPWLDNAENTDSL
jgi:type II secretory pathway pseudopilin PulG